MLVQIDVYSQKLFETIGQVFLQDRLSMIALSEANSAGSDRRLQLETGATIGQGLVQLRLSMIALSQANYAGSDRRLQLETV